MIASPKRQAAKLEINQTDRQAAKGDSLLKTIRGAKKSPDKNDEESDPESQGTLAARLKDFFKK
jgi:hypothetical protein